MAFKDLSPASSATVADASTPAPSDVPAADALAGLLRAPVGPRADVPPVVVGRLLALTDGRATALVSFDGQPGAAAVPARTTVDLFPDHVGQEVLLTFDRLDPARPIVMGVLRAPTGEAELAAASPRVQVTADGQRLTVRAQDELVLQCGRSTIILAADGRLELRADVIVSQAAEVNRIRGGSVQLN